MATELATAWIRLQPSFEGVQQAITKEIAGVPTEKAGQAAGGRFVSGTSKSLAKLGGVVVGAFAVKKVVDFFADSMDAVKNWQVLNAQTAAVVKSTGQSANVTADQVHKLATSIEEQTATQAEAIQSGANMLLTFKNIRNGVGEGNDIFNQATESLVDMARAMGTEPQQAAIQLGKALNDPVAGMAALSRVGIQFSEDQKKVIEGLVASGDLMGAQKVILEELNSQFGGSGESYAATYAGQLFLLQDAFGDVGEELVTKLMPELERLIDWLREDGIKGVEDFAGGIEEILSAIDTLVKSDGWQTFDSALDEGGALDLTHGGFAENIQRIQDKWSELPQSFANGWEQIKSGNRTASAAISTQFQQSSDDWVAKFANGRQQINDGVSAMWQGITSKFANGWTQISTWWTGGWDGLGAKLANGRQQINDGVSGLWSGITGAFANGWAQITGWWDTTWATIRTTVTTAAQTVRTRVDAVLATFQNVARGIRDAFRGIGQFIKDAFGPIADFLGGVGNAVKGFFGGMGDRARHFKGRVQAAAQGGVGGSGGAALARVRATMPAGLRITDTLSNRARDQMLGLNRSVNSYHYDAKNPAVDIAGPTWLLHQYAARLRAMGGWRQFLWQVPGHYDHIHVAHQGGVVSPSWYRSPGDRWDERTVRLQVGETVVPRGFEPVAVRPYSPASPEGARAGATPAVVINGDVHTLDLAEFVAWLEHKKSVAVAFAGIEGA